MSLVDCERFSHDPVVLVGNNHLRLGVTLQSSITIQSRSALGNLGPGHRLVESQQASGVLLPPLLELFGSRVACVHQPVPRYLSLQQGGRLTARGVEPSRVVWRRRVGDGVHLLGGSVRSGNEAHCLCFSPGYGGWRDQGGLSRYRPGQWHIYLLDAPCFPARKTILKRLMTS